MVTIHDLSERGRLAFVWLERSLLLDCDGVNNNMFARGGAFTLSLILRRGLVCDCVCVY